MALVYKAYDTVLSRTVALKVLRSQYACDEDFVMRFKREALSAARLQHENIIRIFDVGEDQDIYYIVMEFQTGPTLKELIRTRGPIPTEVAMEIAFQICQGVAHAHRRSIIHRDIKPHNIIISPLGQVKVTDFGIARAITGSTLTRKGTIVGSVHYFSPEQARGDLTSVQSDIYSLGVVLYEMLTGRLPFEGDSPFSIAMKHISEQPPDPRLINPEIPREAASIILKAMQKDETARYRTATDMLHDMGVFLEQAHDRRDGRSKVLLPGLGQRYSPIAEWMGDISEEGDYREYGELHDGMGGPLDLGDAQSGKFHAEESVSSNVQVGDFPTGAGEKPDDMSSDNDTGVRKKWLTYGMLALAIIVVAVVGYAAFQWMAYLNVPTVIVPDVVGRSLAEAEEMLRDAGLTGRIVGEAYGEIPPGCVVSQDPVAEQKVKEGREISLIVSKGPELEMVPDLIGSTFSEADLLLKSSDLDFGNLVYDYHATAPVDTVFDQNPKPNTWTTRGTLIDLKISKGPKPTPVLVRSVIGLTVDEARDVLEEAGLVLGEITSEESSRFKKGTVMDMSPKPGIEVDPGSSVDLVVSEGQSTQNQYDVTVSVPEGGAEPVRVRVEVLDIVGTHKVHEAVHQPGDVFKVSANWVGDEARLKVYFNDEFKAEQILRKE